MRLTQLNPNNPHQAFPELYKALQEPNGLLAYGGCLSPQRLLNAYRHGVFPWYNAGEPILWWSPNPRLVLFPQKLNISRSLKKTLRKQIFEIRFDQACAEVIGACAAPRYAEGGTWITEEIQAAYRQLHQLGVCHSAEAWQDGELVGGLYGLAIGQIFFGESMFHTQTDASKVAYVHLVRQLAAWGYQMIDCQVSSEHLLSLGAEEISRANFQSLLTRYCNLQPLPQAWAK